MQRDWKELPAARCVALRYAGLEGRMRAVIDSVAAAVCPSCASPCCRRHY